MTNTDFVKERTLIPGIKLVTSVDNTYVRNGVRQIKVSVSIKENFWTLAEVKEVIPAVGNYKDTVDKLANQLIEWAMQISGMLSGCIVNCQALSSQISMNAGRHDYTPHAYIELNFNGSFHRLKVSAEDFIPTIENMYKDIYETAEQLIGGELF